MSRRVASNEGYSSGKASASARNMMSTWYSRGSVQSNSSTFADTSFSDTVRESNSNADFLSVNVRSVVRNLDSTSDGNAEQPAPNSRTLRSDGNSAADNSMYFAKMIDESHIVAATLD